MKEMKLKRMRSFLPFHPVMCGGGGKRSMLAHTVVALALTAPLAGFAGGEERIVSTPAELVAALNDMSTNDAVNVVTLREGYYDLSTIEPMTDDGSWLYVTHRNNWDAPTLRGDPAVSRDRIVLDGKGEKGILSLRFGTSGSGETFYVRNITFRNGNSASNGGAIHTLGKWGDLSVDGCDFYCNRAGKSGGAVGGVLSHRFTDCLFATNRIDGSGYGFGGAVDKATLLKDCTFVANEAAGTAKSVGAAQTREKLNVTVTNCVFDSNRHVANWGYAGGGALHVQGPGTVADCVFTNNAITGSFDGNASARAGGGALAVAGTQDADVIRCRFIDNRLGAASARNGGAVSGGFRTIRDCLFSGNAAEGNGNAGLGGALAHCGGLVSNCTFVGNSACYGGALYVCSNVCDSVFTGNRATQNSGSIGGGAAWRSVLRGCVVTNNAAPWKNGALYQCTASDSYFGDNTGGSQDALQESEYCHFERCVLVGRRDGVARQQFLANCSYSGSVISNMNSTYLFQGATHATNTLVFANEATAVCLDAAGTFVNCSFVSNRYDRLSVHAASDSPLAFVNTLFCGKRTRDWPAEDDVCATDAAPSALDGYTNCYFKTRWEVAGSNNLNEKDTPSLFQHLRLMTLRRDGRHPFAPRRRSVLNGAGLVLDWMSADGAVDLAGQSRLTDGRVAIGAYETTDRGPFPRLRVLIR